MKDFNERDLDRNWSQEEIESLSEGELTKLAFKRDYKNLAFFLPVGIVILFLSTFGLFGKIVGWIGIIMFGLFSLQGLMNLGLGIISLIGAPIFDRKATVKNSAWKSLQLIISAVNFFVYGVIVVLIYVRMQNLDIAKYFHL